MRARPEARSTTETGSASRRTAAGRDGTRDCGSRSHRATPHGESGFRICTITMSAFPHFGHSSGSVPRSRRKASTHVSFSGVGTAGAPISSRHRARSLRLREACRPKWRILTKASGRTCSRKARAKSRPLSERVLTLPVLAVLVAEDDGLAVVGDDARVRDGDAVHIAREVAHDVLRAGERSA